MAGLSRVLALVDISDMVDQQCGSGTPLSARAVGPGHGVRHPQQRLVPSPKVTVRQIRRGRTAPDSCRYQATLPFVLARFSALNDQSPAS